MKSLDTCDRVKSTEYVLNGIICPLSALRLLQGVLTLQALVVPALNEALSTYTDRHPFHKLSLTGTNKIHKCVHQRNAVVTSLFDFGCFTHLLANNHTLTRHLFPSACNVLHNHIDTTSRFTLMLPDMKSHASAIRMVLGKTITRRCLKGSKRYHDSFFLLSSLADFDFFPGHKIRYVFENHGGPEVVSYLQGGLDRWGMGIFISKSIYGCDCFAGF